MRSLRAEGVMYKDDVATFLTRLLTKDTGACHKLQCKVISKAVRQVASRSWNVCLFKTTPYFVSGRDLRCNVSQDEAPFSDAPGQ